MKQENIGGHLDCWKTKRLGNIQSSWISPRVLVLSYLAIKIEGVYQIQGILAVLLPRMSAILILEKSQASR